MTSRNSSDSRADDQRKPPVPIDSPAKPSRQTSPPIVNDGLELPRDSHC